MNSTLRPSDVAVAFQLLLTPAAPYAKLAQYTQLSVGETHNAVKRLVLAKLVSRHDRRVNPKALHEFLTGGVPYAFPAELGAEARGIPTAYAAEPLASQIVSDDVVVWPSPQGTKRGQSLTPLYPGAPATAAHNPELYRLLALTDALRIGRARERQLARDYLRKFMLDQKSE